MDATRREDGGVLVLTAVCLPLLIIFCSFVIDIGNWFEHRRHLQMQADAAALAAAGDFKIGAACDDALITTRAEEYGGEATDGYNHQIGGTPADKVELNVNSKYWPWQESGDGDTAVKGTPCQTGMIDVKMTERDLPWFFKALDVFWPGGSDSDVDFINTHARVELRKLDSARGQLPLGVRDPTPERARVWYVDEDAALLADGTRPVLATAELTQPNATGDPALWTSTAASVDVTTTKVGVRVALGSKDQTISSDQAVACADAFVKCYDLGAKDGQKTGSKDGVMMIRGAAGGDGSLSAPKLRDVRLAATSGDCTSAYFSMAGSSCTFELYADLDFGTTTPDGGSVKAKIGGNTHTLTKLDLDPNATGTTTTWRVTGLTFPNNAEGPVPIDILWSTSCSNCSGTFGTALRPFRGTDARSGPIREAAVTVDGAPNRYVVKRCATAGSCVYSVQLGLRLAQLDSTGLVTLKLGGGSNTSQMQGLDCDPLWNSEDEFAGGCRPFYKVNTTGNCPADAQTLWGMPNPPPYDCVPIATGNFEGQVRHGLNRRILNAKNPTVAGGCPNPNQWGSDPNSTDPAGAINASDPRYVQLFITGFQEFLGSGGGMVPIKDFGGFYITGWSDSKTYCPTDDPAGSGEVVGHFLTYVSPSSGGTPSNDACDLDDPFSSCIATLTR